MTKAETIEIKVLRRNRSLAALCLLGIFAIIEFVAVTTGGPRRSPLPKSSTDIGETRIGRIISQRLGDKCHELLADNHPGNTVAGGAPCAGQKIVNEQADSEDRFSAVSKAFSQH